MIFDELTEMGELALVGVQHMIQNLAWVLHDMGLLALLIAFEGFGHG